MKAISLLILIVACSSREPKDPYAFIGQGLQSKAPELRECYMSSPNYLRNEGAEIRSKIEFELQLDGTTTNHKVLDSSLKDKKFDDCLVTKLKSLKYPPQKESVIVEQAFNFYPRKL